MQADVSRLSHPSSIPVDLTPPQRREYLSLQDEKDPELRGTALLALAQRLERSKSFNSAAQIYSELEQGISPISEQARRRLQVLNGSGNFGDQAEFSLQQISTSIADPAALVAMGAAGAAYRMVRLTALSRLIATPNAGWFTRGLGARALASTLAFAAEGSVFPAAHSMAARALDQSHIPGGSIGERAVSSYCALGGLRLAAMVGRTMARGLTPGLGSTLFQQGTMLGGILLGSGLERALDIRAERPWSATLAQALTTLLHFNASTALFRSLSGPRFQAWERGMEIQTQSLESGLSAGPRAVLGLRAPALVEGTLWWMAGDQGGKRPTPQTPIPEAAAASRPRAAEKPPTEPKTATEPKTSERVLEYTSSLDVITDLIKRDCPIVLALAEGKVRVRINQSVGGWPSGFLASFVKAINRHLDRQGTSQGLGEEIILELYGRSAQTVRIVKVGNEFKLGKDSRPPPSDPNSNPFVTATNLLKGKAGASTKAEVPPKVAAPSKAAASPAAPEPPLTIFDRELKVEVSYIRQGIGSGQAKLIFRENYPADFLKRRTVEIGNLLHARSNHMLVPLGFRVTIQIGEGENPQEVVFIKSVGGYRKP